MMDLLGMPLDKVVCELVARGVEAPSIIIISGRNPAQRGEDRVIRIRENGRELTVARFPTTVDMDPTCVRPS